MPPSFIPASNTGCALATDSNRCFADINVGGGNDFEIHRNHYNGNAFIQVDEVLGGGFEINGFHAQVVAPYAYPYANVASVVIGPAGPWGFHTFYGNTLSELNNGYPGDQWTALPNGTTRFIGLRGTVGGQTRYGWIRLTKNNFGNFTLVDWAYEDTGAQILTGQTVVLPVGLTAFDYRLQANDLQPSWRTASEQNNAGFDVERSEDGTTFRSIAWVEGKGTTTEEQQYLYDDKNLRAGKTYYYRLRQVDFSDKFEFSSVLSVTVSGKGAVVGQFYPNPARSGQVALDFVAPEAGEWRVSVYDATGKLATAQNLSIVTVAGGSHAVSFDFSGLGSGVYFVKMEHGTEAIYRKLVIE